MRAMRIEWRDKVAIVHVVAGKANALSPELIDALGRLLDELAAGAPRAAVITGYEGFFCAGLDLPSLYGLERPAMEAFIRRFDALMLRIFELPLPVVAAINGHAVAGGCVLALQADQRLMAEGKARIGLSEVPLGIGLPSAVVETLRAQVPAASLMPIATEGKLLLPAEALALGLVHEVVAPSALLDRAAARAAELGALPSAAFAQVKAALRRPAARRARDEDDAETARWLDTWYSPEGRKRIGQMVEKLAQRG